MKPLAEIHFIAWPKIRKTKTGKSNVDVTINGNTTDLSKLLLGALIAYPHFITAVELALMKYHSIKPTSNEN